MEKPSVGIIGTGLLGNAVGLNLLRSGFRLTVYNRTARKTADLAKEGALVAAAPSEVAEKSELVITILRDADAVSNVLFGSAGVVRGMHDGMVVADMSTINPFKSKEISGRLAQHDIAKLDIPVMGGPNVAVSGDLVLMGSGNAAEFERFRPVWDAVASRVFYLGASGAAHSVKLAMNLQITMLALALSEGMVLVERCGIAPETFLDVLNSTYFKTGMSQNKAYKMIKGGYDPTFTLRNLKKDIDTMLSAAETLGMSLPMAEAASLIYRNAEAEGFADLDYTEVIRMIKKMNGIK